MSVDVLQAKIRKTKNPTMVGLDPTPELIPPALLEAAIAEKGENPEALALAYARFCCGILDALKGFVPAVKVQSACFTAIGHAGVEAMEAVLAYAQKLKYYVLLETMRSDVGHIAQLSAQAVFGGIEIGTQRYFPYPCDGLVINGYFGSDGIKPYLPYLEGPEPKNLFVVVRSSNRSAGEVQDLISGDRNIHTAMADLTLRWNGETRFGKCGYGEVGAVVGGLTPSVIQNLRKRYDTLFFLITGYGAQGGVAKHAGYAFDRLGHGAIVCASRSILGAWREPDAPEDYRQAALAAAEKMKRQLDTYVTVL